MTAEREKIYRRILYVGLIDIRNLSYCATNDTSFAIGLTAADCINCVAGLAEWLHALAGRAQDFDTWSAQEESFFAICCQGYRQQFSPGKYPVLVHDVVRLLG